MGGDEVDHLVQRVEHPEAQQVELDQADRRAVVLVPLEHAAPGIRPHSTGQTSMTGRSHRTMPAEWIPRWRGRSSSC